MIPRSTLIPASAALLVAFGLPETSAQSSSIAIPLNHVVASGEGISRSCLESGYSTGLGVRYAHPAFSALTSIELTARAYVFGASPTCVDGFPPPDGTYVQIERLNLLAASFVSTDLRFRGRLTPSPRSSSLAIGIGYTWRSRHNLPYILADLHVPIIARGTVHVSAEGELQIVRVVTGRYRRTYQNFQLVASESLGRSYDGSHAVSLALMVEIPLAGRHR